MLPLNHDRKGDASRVHRGLWGCVVYMAVWGILCFPLGRLFKRLRLNWARPPFSPFPWEKEGQVYERLGIRRWKDIAPDVSKLFPSIVPRKTLSGRLTPELVRDMLEETCVAELTHLVLCIVGLALAPLWPGAGGILLYIAYVALGNVPFIIIQRYNRPRFRRMLTIAEARERRQSHARTDTFEQ